VTSASERRLTAVEWELWLRGAVSYLSPEHRGKALEAARKVKPGAVIKAHAAIINTLPDTELRAILRELEESLLEVRA
jgi:hypothetical protein